MPEPVILAAPTQGRGLAEATIGFCGKLPARGDFINVRLPRGFVDPWYDWLQQSLLVSRKILSDDWESLWNEAPIWRFALSPGICGPDAVLGLWMPSVDRVGRHFPITFAAIIPGDEIADLIRDGGPFLSVAETAGLDALASDLAPSEIERRIAPDTWEDVPDSGISPEYHAPGGALWWTDGAPHVGAAVFTTAALPDETVFTSMLAAGDVPKTGEGSP